jgi:hypothetical protein
MSKLNLNNLEVWPHLTIVAVVVALVAGVGVGWWVRHEQTVSAKELPNAARIQRVDGQVLLNNSGANTTATDQSWLAASVNQPFTVGDRIYTRDNSHANLAFTGRNFARLNPNTSLDILSLTDQRTQLALRDGSAVFDVGYLQPNDLFEVATPYGAVDLQQPGLYDVGINNGNVIVSVLSGLAQVVGLGGSGQINRGEMLTLLGQTAADVVLSRVDGRNAGYLVDDYYSSQYPRYYDGRYRDYDVYLNDPYYFDPYRRTSSYQYVNSYIPGISDLDYYGDWRNLNGYGNAWCPRVDSSWAPYQEGYWLTDYPYGPTWVSEEPWGYAPYHYGRWAYVSNQWYWVPDNVNTYPAYSPALVAFLPFAQNDIGWVPLAPGDPYAPRYYYNDWQPYYLTRTQVVQQQVANLYVPNAVSVVNVDDFNRGFDWRRERRADRQMLANVRPVLDPLTLTPLRNAVVHSAWGRGKIDLPPGIAKKLQDTTVVTSTTPVSPPFRRDLARSMRVEEVNTRSRGRKFNVRDERGAGNERAAQAPVQAPVPEQPRNNEPARGRFNQEQPRVQNASSAFPNSKADRGARGVMQPRGERVAQPAQPRGRPEIQRQQNPSMRREPGNMRSVRPSAPVNRAPERPVVQPRMREQRGRPSQPVQQVQPRAMEQPRPVRQPTRPVQQTQPRAMEQPRNAGNPGHGRGRPAEVSQPVTPRAQPQPQQRPSHPGNGQPAVRQQQQQQQKASPPTGQPGGGKGKGKKPNG